MTVSSLLLVAAAAWLAGNPADLPSLGGSPKKPLVTLSGLWLNADGPLTPLVFPVVPMMTSGRSPLQDELTAHADREQLQRHGGPEHVEQRRHSEASDGPANRPLQSSDNSRGDQFRGPHAGQHPGQRPVPPDAQRREGNPSPFGGFPAFPHFSPFSMGNHGTPGGPAFGPASPFRDGFPSGQGASEGPPPGPGSSFGRRPQTGPDGHPAAGQNLRMHHENGPGPSPLAGVLFHVLDQNHDGQLSPPEFSRLAEALEQSHGQPSRVAIGNRPAAPSRLIQPNPLIHGQQDQRRGDPPAGGRGQPGPHRPAPDRRDGPPQRPDRPDADRPPMDRAATDRLERDRPDNPKPGAEPERKDDRERPDARRPDARRPETQRPESDRPDPERRRERPFPPSRPDRGRRPSPPPRVERPGPSKDGHAHDVDDRPDRERSDTAKPTGSTAGVPGTGEWI